MFRKIATVGLLTLATALLLQQTNAQDSKRDGARIGEIIGATDGASIAKSMESRPQGHYLYQSRCWDRRADGSYVSVTTNYCSTGIH